jgi:2-desacetyl-2-hydroxyethyl bacteriochlorophyllide A dehydrogenase
VKALVWEAPRVLAMREQSQPEPQAHEVLIKVAYAGICGSELSGYLGHNALRTPPLVMGHEFSGEVVALGSEADPTLAVGTSVTVNPLVSCGVCAACQQQLPHLCEVRQLIGAGRPGAFAEYLRVPTTQVVPLPSLLALRSGALTEPCAVAVRVGELAGPLAGETALVLGAGAIGLLVLQVLKQQGASQIFIADRDPARLAMGEALGGVPIDARSQNAVQVVRSTADRHGVALAVDAVGAAATRAQCVGAVRSGGTVILSGLHEETSAMPVAEIIRREIVLRGCFCYTNENFQAALALLSQGAITLEPWIVEAPLSEGGAWFDRLIDAPGDVAKVLLVP